MAMIEQAKQTGYTSADHFPKLRKELKEKINNGALQYMDEKNMAETFLGKMKDSSLEILPQLNESKSPRTDSCRNRQTSAVRSTLKEILGGFKSGHMSVVGPAGSGKSTLLKTIARNVIEKKYEVLSNVEVVVYIKCGDLDTSKFSTPAKLLLSMIQPQLRDDELKEFQEYAQANPSKVLFVLDGLDTFPGYFYKETSLSNRKESRVLNERKRVKDILCKIMEGKLFQDCRIITSSRDITELGQSKKYTVKVVNLSGLTESSIKKITYQYFSAEEAEAFITYLEEQPELLDLCQTPMFLIFTLIGKKKDPEFSPTMMSEILLFLLDCLLRSEHSTLQESDLKNLGELCFWLMKEQIANFSKEDLTRYHLTVKKVQNLVVDTPGAEYRRMFFIHQSIVEILSCFHIINMSHQGLSAFAQEHLGEFRPDFALVEQMLCGIVLNESVHKKWGFLQVDSLKEKRAALKHHLSERIRRLNMRLASAETEPFHVLNLVLSLHEAGESVEPIVKSSLRAIILDGSNLFFRLSVSDVRAIGTVVARCDHLDIFALNFWFIQDDHVSILHSCISKTCTKIAKMELEGNNMTPDGMMHAGRLIRCCHVKDMSLAWSDLSFTTGEPQDAIKSLKSSLQEYKLEKLNISFRTPEMEECNMTPQNRTWNVEVPYVVDYTQDLSWPQKLLADTRPKIVWGISVPGLWRQASNEFAHAIGNLMMNVTERMDVYNWKFSNSGKDILRTKRRNTESAILEIHISKNQVISDCNTVNLKREQNLRQGTQKFVQVSEIREITEVPELEGSSNPSAEVVLREVPPKEEPDFGRTSLSSVVNFFSTNDHITLDWVEKFQLSHQQVTEEQLSKLSVAFTKIRSLKEFEFRNCRPDSQLMLKLLEILEETKTKISKLSVTASNNIDHLFPELIRIMDLCETRSLNIEETEDLGDFLQLFLEYLLDRQIDNFQELNLSHVKDMEDFKTLGRIISGKVKDLKLVNCDLETEKLQDMCATVDSSKIRHLDLSYNPDLIEEDIALLPRLLCNEGVQLLALRDCCLSSDEVQAFDDPLFNNLTVHELDLSYNGELGSDGIEITGSVARKLCTKKLSLGSCELDEECLKSLMNSLQDHNLPSLDLRENPRISCKKVAELIEKCKTRSLNIRDCKLDSDQISTFADALTTSEYKLRELNLSDSQRVVIDKTFVEAIRKVMKVVEEKLIICFPRLEMKSKEMIKESLNEPESQNVKVIFHESRRSVEGEFLTLVGTK